MSRSFWMGFATLYAITALIFAGSMYRAMPALNVVGAAYYGAVWPAWPISVLLNRALLPIPAWAFTFKEPTHDQ